MGCNLVNTVLVEKMGTKLKSEKTAVQQVTATNQESYTREKEEDHPPLSPRSYNLIDCGRISWYALWTFSILNVYLFPFISKGLVGDSSLKPMTAWKQEAGILAAPWYARRRDFYQQLGSLWLIPGTWQPQALMCSWPALIEESHSEQGRWDLTQLCTAQMQARMVKSSDFRTWEGFLEICYELTHFPTQGQSLRQVMPSLGSCSW